MRDLQKDLEICEKATPGPWKVDRKNYSAVYVTAGDKKAKIFYAKQDAYQGIYNFVNADYVAESREGWPEAIKRAMVAEEALRKIERDILGDYYESELSPLLEAVIKYVREAVEPCKESQ